MKIDGSLIDGIDHAGGVNRAIVETIVKVSHSLDLCTVAEAVETAAQVAILRELGADVGQGYFFAPPLAADETLALTDMDLLPIFPLGPPTHNHGKATKELIPEGRVVVDEVVDEEAGVADEGTKPDPDPDPDRDPEKAATATNPATEKAVAEMTVTEKTHTENPVTEKTHTEKTHTENPVTEKTHTEKTHTEKTDTEKTRAAGSTKTGSTGRKRRKPAPRRGHAA
jgi:hypothetical protein